MGSQLKLVYPLETGIDPVATVNEGVESIIAVHGLNEDLLGAWTDSATGKLWLRDLLPHDGYVARVLSFGYEGSPSSFFDADCETAPVTTIAGNLVSYLQADRELANCDQRPIIFICHGLGGLIVKKALMDSRDRTSFVTHRGRGIFTCTTGILFFGTPHGQVLTPAVWFGTRRVADLSRPKNLKHTSALQSVNQNFATISWPFSQLFFWEVIETHVGHSSAVPQGIKGESAGIDADHAGMVKFATLNSGGYPVVRNNIRRICQKAHHDTKLRWARSQETLQREWIEQISVEYGPRMDIKDAKHTSTSSGESRRRIFMLPKHQHLGPVEFIGRGREREQLYEAFLDLHSYQLDGSPRIFVVHGMGGAGKTELSSWFARHHREQFKMVVTIDATSPERIKSSLAELGERVGLEATDKAGLHILDQFDEPFLLIIDNADDPQFKPWDLIPRNDSGSVIITTRNRILRGVANVGSLELQGLEKKESLQLLLTCSEIPEPWDEVTENHGAEICEMLGHLALALVVAGRSIQEMFHGSQKLQTYLGFYKSKRNTYRPSNYGVDGTEMIFRDQKEKGIAYPAFEISLEHLRREESQSCRDAIEILNIFAFYHRQNISIDLFTKAVRNRSSSSNSATSIRTRMLQSIMSRLHPPPVVPSFLKSVSPEKEVHRAREGISKLVSLSLVNIDTTTSEFSLHPLVYAWAGDRLSHGERKVWARIALNVLAETITLPTQAIAPGQGQVDETHKHDDFHRSLLPHLDTCLPLCSIDIPNFDDMLPRIQLYLSPFLLPTFVHILREQVSSMARIGYVYGECGRFKESLQYLQRVEKLLHISLGPDNPRTMTVMLGLAKIHWGLGQLEEAIRLQNIVVSARERTLGPNHEDTLVAMDELGRSYWLNGQYRDALDQAEKTKTRMDLTLGPEDRRTLVAMDRYGVALQSWHRFHDSARIHMGVLKIREIKLGPKDLETLESKNNLAMTLMDLKRFDEAEALMLEVYDGRTTQLGKEHPWTLWALCYHAKILVKTEQLDKAERLLLEGIEAANRSLPEDHLGILMGKGELSRVYSRQSRLGEAFDLLSHTVERLEKTRGTEHPDSFYAKWKLSILHQRRGELDEAIETCQIALQRAQRRLTDVHPLVGMIQADLARLRKDRHPQGRQSQAESALASKPNDPKPGLEFRARLTW